MHNEKNNKAEQLTIKILGRTLKSTYHLCIQSVKLAKGASPLENSQETPGSSVEEGGFQCLQNSVWI